MRLFMKESIVMTGGATGALWRSMRVDKLHDLAAIALEVQVVALHAHVVARVGHLAALAADP